MPRTANRVGVRRRLLTTLAAVAVVGSMAAVTAAPVAAASLVVTDWMDSEADDALCSLREAIQAANTDTATLGCPAGSGADTITFAPEITAISLTTTLIIDSSITLGGPHAVTLDGTDSFRIFFVSSGTSTLRDLVITDGAAFNHGGAIVVDTGAALTLQRVTVSSSSAPGSGGGATTYGSLTVVDSTFTGNSAGSGGAIGFGGPGTSLTVSGSTFTGNSAGSGGAIVATGAPLAISRSSFAGNTATNHGGAIYCNCTAFSLADSTVSGNLAGATGGGVFLDLSGGAVASVRGSTIDSNTAQDGAGIQAFSALSVVNSTIWGNTASGKGGAINREAGLTLVHATIGLNAANGGATAGGGIFSADGSPSMTLKNSVVAGNTNGDYAFQGTVPSPVPTNSLLGLGGGAFTLDDLFNEAGLQDNGGPTKTVRPANVAGNPLLGGADSTTCTSAPAGGKDQRGFGRTAPCDIGAVELDRTKPVASAAKASLRRGVALGDGSRLQVRLTWSASDVDSGLASYTIQRSVNGGTYTTIGTSTTKSFNTTLASGTTYRFRVRAIDREGNKGDYARTASFTARRIQQSSSSVSFRGSWTTTTSSVFSGGSARRSSTAGSSVTYSGTGRSFAFISTLGPNRGKAKVYVDGVYRETIDLYKASPTTYRVQVWSKTYSSSTTHRVRIVVSGTSGRPRIDADAFAVLR